MTSLVHTHLIELTQLEALMRELAEQRQDIAIRLQMEGQLFPEHFSTVLVFSRHAILLTHMPTRTVTNVATLDRVTAFEIDRPHKGFSPFQRYVMNPVCERLNGRKNGLLHA